jgi:hypothetical protein
LTQEKGNLQTLVCVLSTAFLFFGVGMVNGPSLW